MASVSVYLDIRTMKDFEAQLKVAISKKGSSAYIPLGIWIKPNQWDRLRCKVKDHPNKAKINLFVQNRVITIQNTLMTMTLDGELTGMTATQIKNKIIQSEKDDNEITFLDYFKKFTDLRKTANTRRIYRQTYEKITSYDKKSRLLRFEDINKGWLMEFEKWLREVRRNAINTIAIDMRNIRAVFNDAIDNDITTNYPFRKKYKIIKSPTKKRSLSIDKLRTLFDYKVEPFMQKYIDTFKLTFFLIGINPVDLCGLTKIENGRIIFNRAKTGRLYSIKVEPEALHLFDKYRGKKHIFGLAEGMKDYFSFLTMLDKNLKRIGRVELVNNPNYNPHSNFKKFLKVRHPEFPNLSIYWARHTWATVAASLDIPKETISMALGHGYGNQTTSIYIDFDMKKVDEANRKVLDYVLYDKR